MIFTNSFIVLILFFIILLLQAHISMQKENIYQSIGILRANWYNSSGKLTTFNYGTAFAITDRIVLTCTHNIFSEKTKIYASEIIFIPGINSSTITEENPRFRSIEGRYYKSEMLTGNSDEEPTKEELALVVLKQPLKTKNFLKIGPINPSEILNQMEVIGYPSERYRKSLSLNNITAKRKESLGRVYSPKKQMSHILKYTMETGIGVSGSPVLMQKRDKTFKIVGIHTHKGQYRKYNSGLYFTTEILQKMAKWIKQLEKQFELKQSHVFQEPQYEIQENKKPSDKPAEQKSDQKAVQEDKIPQPINIGYKYISQQEKEQRNVVQEEEQFQNTSVISSSQYDIFEEDLDQLLRIDSESASETLLPYTGQVENSA